MATPGPSVPFDRIADRYDATRRLSPEAGRATIDLLLTELGSHGPCLEVGVGTGRLALPLARAGIEMIGLDLSEPMLRRLVENAGGLRPFPLVRGDATALPLRDASVGSALLAHVLHLVPAWERALGELVRAVRAGGSVVTVVGRLPSDLREVVDRFTAEAGIDRAFPGLDHDLGEVDRAMAGLGTTPRPLGTVTHREPVTMDGYLRQAADGIWSWTWGAEEAARRAAARRLRPWAAERFGDLGRSRMTEMPMEIRAYDVP